MLQQMSPVELYPRMHQLMQDIVMVCLHGCSCVNMVIWDGKMYSIFCRANQVPGLVYLSVSRDACATLEGMCTVVPIYKTWGLGLAAPGLQTLGAANAERDH